MLKESRTGLSPTLHTNESLLCENSVRNKRGRSLTGLLFSLIAWRFLMPHPPLSSFATEPFSTPRLRPHLVQGQYQCSSPLRPSAPPVGPASSRCCRKRPAPSARAERDCRSGGSRNRYSHHAATNRMPVHPYSSV